MVVPIAPIGAIAPIGSLNSITPTASAANPGGVDGTPTTGAGGGTDFATALSNGLDQVGAAQSNAQSLAVQAATGQLTDPAALTVATTQATLMTQLATTLESKAVAAFNTIMGMQA